MQYTIYIIYNKMHQFITPIRMVCIKNNNNKIRGVARQWRNWNAHVLLVRICNSAAAWKTVWRVLKKFGTELPCDPAIPSQLKCPMADEQINKTGSTYMMEYGSALKREDVLTPASMWMDPEDVTLSDINQSQKDNFCILWLM